MKSLGLYAARRGVAYIVLVCLLSALTPTAWADARAPVAAPSTAHLTGSLSSGDVPITAGSRDSAGPLTVTGSRYSTGSPTSSNTVAWTASYLVMNTLPGFGLGSLLQGDRRSAAILAGADALAWGLLIPGAVAVNNVGAGETVPIAALFTLMGGYAAYAASRTAGLALPTLHAWRHGVDPHALAPPIVLNMIPLTGLGSALQGDRRGARLIRYLDLGAWVAVGILSAAALDAGGGQDAQNTAQAAGIAAVGLFAGARALGVVLPIRYRNRARYRSNVNRIPYPTSVAGAVPSFSCSVSPERKHSRKSSTAARRSVDTWSDRWFLRWPRPPNRNPA